MILSLFLGLFLLNISYARTIVPLGLEENYAIVFDAGSKGTRLYLFKYSLAELINASAKGLNVAHLDYNFEQLLYCELNDNGLGQYTSALEIPEKFETCVTKAEKMIPEVKRPLTFISLIATAGLRLLEIRDKPLNDALLQGVRDYFRTLPFLYLSESQVRMIEGWEEGVFSLLASNYLKKQFFVNSFNREIYGIIDVGGASAQISFLPTDFELNQKDLHSIQISKSVYPLYSHSYLCYGTAQILNMYSAKNIREQEYSTNSLLASCYPQGYDFKYTGEDLLMQPCVNGLMFESDRPFTLEKSRVESKLTYTVSGNSKKNKCRDEVKQMIPDLECKEEGLCTIDGVYQPRVSGNRYLALGNLFEALDLTGRLYGKNFDGDMPAFNETTYDLCSKTYKQLETMNKASNAGIGKNRLAKLCLENVYLIRYLEVLGFKSLDNIYATEYIDGKKANWVLGVLIHDLNHLNGFSASQKFTANINGIL